MKRKNTFKEDYPYIVVPLDETEKRKAKHRGLPNTFTRTMDSAIEIMERQNKYSGVIWRIKRTEHEVLDWSI